MSKSETGVSAVERLETLLKPGTVLAKIYTVQQCIGYGAFGIVIEAHRQLAEQNSTTNNDVVAIKIESFSSTLRILKREARILRELQGIVVSAISISISISIRPSVHLHQLSISLIFLSPSVRPSVHPSLRPSVHPSLRPSVHLHLHLHHSPSPFPILHIWSADTQSPSICKYIDLFEDEERQVTCLVMQRIGPNLKATLNNRKAESNDHPHPEQFADRLRAVAYGILQALQCLHSHGYVHRDIKPSNICQAHSHPHPHPRLHEEYKVFLIDFGLCRKLCNGDDRQNKKRFVGTRKYASVKVHEGHLGSAIDDMWSLFYTMLVRVYR